MFYWDLMANVKVQCTQANSIYSVLHTNDPVSKTLIIIFQALFWE